MFGAQRLGLDTVLGAALWYAEVLNWDVAPGESIRADERRVRCTCPQPGCPAPGEHPRDQADAWWTYEATTDAGTIRAWWGRWPDAPIVLPAGRTFDVISVPERAGRWSLARLERMSAPVGPVAVTPGGRSLFFAAPGAREDLPRLLRRLGWGSRVLGISCLGDGDYVIAPPSACGAAGAMRWEQPPRACPQPMPAAHVLLGTLAFACNVENRRRGRGPTRIG
jgi:Bifunctional DNA primase/polymerase, N-terminal